VPVSRKFLSTVHYGNSSDLRSDLRRTPPLPENSAVPANRNGALPSRTNRRAPPCHGGRTPASPAQSSTSFAGLAGLYIALRPHDAAWKEYEVARVRTIILYGLTALLACSCSFRWPT
jgi:hypothetical protein